MSSNAADQHLSMLEEPDDDNPMSALTEDTPTDSVSMSDTSSMDTSAMESYNASQTKSSSPSMEQDAGMSMGM